MTLKYARMEGQLQPLTQDTWLETILGQQLAWQREVAQKFSPA